MKQWRIVILIIGAAVGALLGYFSSGEPAQIGSRLLMGGVIGLAVSFFLSSATSSPGDTSEEGRRSFG